MPDGSSLPYADIMCLSSKTFWAINKQSWPEQGHQRLPPPLAVLTRGKSYIFELVNRTPHMHPIHIHGHTFTVLDSNKRELPQHLADTVLLTPKERIRVAFVADNPGDWMFHCHIIEHQETGMMGIIRVS
jgi:FtsP/CotA-like multicopper oxidase with cupredoxin domain